MASILPYLDDGCPGESSFLDFLEGALSDVARGEFERHVDRCADCQVLLGELVRELRSPCDQSESGAAVSGDASTMRPDLGSARTLAASPPAATPPAATAAAGIEHAPARLGRYLVIEPLGAGGMGVVYAAYDAELDRKLAIKLLRAGRDSADEQARLQREAQAMARLSHSNVVSVFDVGALDDAVFVAMEFVDGQTLRAWRKDQDRSWREVLTVYLQAGRGLGAAHAAGLVHRDFKPHNAMIDGAGVVKVLDFGLARLGPDRKTDSLAVTRDDDADSQRSTSPRRALTRTGAVMGTPAYMPPEQHEGRAADARSDQFSFCVALYEALYDQHPFPCDSLVALVTACSSGQVRPAPAHARVPSWVRSVLLRGLSPAPRDRFPSMDALLSALDRDPAAARRRRRALLALCAGIAAASFGVAALTTSDAAPCVGVESSLDEIWSQARAESLQAALIATGAPRADTTWRLARPRLQRYADAWLDARASACDERRRGLLSDELYTLQTACLDRRRASLDALLDIASAGDDPALVDHLTTAVASLPAVAPCGDAAYVSAELRPPESRALSAAVAEQRAQLVRAQEHEHLGQYAKALTLVDESLRRADALGYQPLLAEAWFRRGSALTFALTDPPAADEALTRALAFAIASGHERLSAEAATKRLFARSELLREHELAARDLPLAEAMVTRASDVPWLRGQILHNAGVLRQNRGELLAAREAYEAAVDEKRRTLAEDDPELLYSLANLGGVLAELRSYERSEQLLGEALARAESLFGPAHPQTALLAVMLAATQRDLGRYERAGEHLDRARAIQASMGESPALAPTLTILGDLALERRAFDEAHALFTRALNLISAHLGPEAPFTAVALIGLARAEAGRGDGDPIQTLERAAVAGDERYAGYARVFLGERHRAAGDLEAAVAELRQAVTLTEAADGPDSVFLTLAVDGLAQTLHAAGEFDRAAEELETLLRQQAPALPTTDPYLAHARRSLADTLMELDRRDDAVDQLRQAVAAYATVRAPQDPELANTRYQLARALTPGCHTNDEASALARRAQAALASSGPAYAEELRAVNRWLDRRC